MGEVTGKLTVFFEEPFWVGVFERYEDGKLSVAKVTFGSEPKDYDINKFILGHYYSLQFSPAVAAVVMETKKIQKRMQRDAKKTDAGKRPWNKITAGSEKQQEQNKHERKAKCREQKLAETERMFELKQQKKKEKHRGH